jgi:signal transduction histidine kinase
MWRTRTVIRGCEGARFVSGDQLLSYMTRAIFVFLFILVTINALRQPLWTNLNVVLLFAMPTAVILIGIAAQIGLIQPGPIPNAINAALVLAVAYMMLRLVDDFTAAPQWLLWAGGIGFVLLAIGGFVFAPPRPFWFTLAQLLYFIGFEIYAGLKFFIAARHTVGITRRRMHAVAWGSLLLGCAITVSALRPLAPWMQQTFNLFALASSIGYFIGFAPPLRLRRSWQEPELRTFLAVVSRFSQQLTEPVELRQIERAAAAALGTEEAWIGRWSESRQQLDYSREGREQFISPEESTVTGRAFLNQRPFFTVYYPGASIRPTLLSAVNLEVMPRAVLAAPITSSQRRFGVLSVFTHHAPVIVAEDLELVELLAGQIAAMFETRELAEALSRSQAISEANRLKEDFLSVAAHDLKTPLTTIIGQAQRLERRIRADQQAGAYLAGVELIVREGQRLRHIVNELLDATRVERGDLLSEREEVDLAAMVRELAEQHSTPRHQIIIEGEQQLIGRYDLRRVQQLLEHLLDNAVLYSPKGGTITITLKREGSNALLSIRDQGIGIPPEDLPHLFGRFFRGSNVDDRHYVGMGLSLFICRGIVEQHGGTIEATSVPDEGSTFLVSLPIESEKTHYAAA